MPYFFCEQQVDDFELSLWVKTASKIADVVKTNAGNICRMDSLMPIRKTEMNKSDQTTWLHACPQILYEWNLWFMGR